MKTSRRALFKTLLKRKIGELFTSGGSADVFIITRKVYKRLSYCMWTFLAASLEELITRDPPGRPMKTLVHKVNIFRTTVRYIKTVPEDLRYKSNIVRR
jgi:hypothetical protein